MKDQRVVQAFAGAPQNYMMELERRVSGTQADIVANAVTSADGLAALAAVVDALSLNYGFGSSVASFTTASTTYVDITGMSCSITTTGGDLLVIIAGGGFANTDFQETAYLAVLVNGTDYVVSDYLQNITADTDDVSVPFAGLYVVTGLAAGTYTVVGRAKTTAGGAVDFTGDSRSSIFALELSL